MVAKKETKPKAKKLTKDDMLAEAGELLKKIENQERVVQQYDQKAKDMKDCYTNLKGARSAAIEELRKLCRMRSEKLPLFDQKKAKAKKGNNGKQSELPGVAVEAGATAPADVDAWRTKPIETLGGHGLANATIDLLVEAGIDTLGQFCDFQQQHGEFWVKDIKGLGAAKASKVADAFEAFWKENPAYCQAAAGEPEKIL